MALGANSLQVIRSLFRKNEFERIPFVPPVGYQGLGSQHSFFGSGIPSELAGLSEVLRIDPDLTTRFMDYEDQDDLPICSSAIEIYAEDATQVDSEHGETVWVECEDGEIREEIEELLKSRIKIEDRVYEDMRTLVKYGNWYAEIVAKEGQGVIALNSLPPPQVRRIEIPKEIGNLSTPRIDLRADTLGFIYDPSGLFSISTSEFIKELNGRVEGSSQEVLANLPNQQRRHSVVVFEGWEVVHARLRGKNPNSVYGYGVGEPARWIVKRLQMLEDSIILHRLSRAPSRYAFYIDVTAIPPGETQGYLNRVKQALKKQKFTNPQTGKLDYKFDVLSSQDDFFLPVRDGKESTRVESLQGPVYDHIEDIKFFEEKLFAAYRIPKPFLTYEQSTAKTHLSAEDARFARSVMRVQREYIQALTKVCRVHLAARGVNPDTVQFRLRMTIPSAIFELSQLEIRGAELELASKFTDWAPKTWIQKNVLGFSDDQIREMRALQAEEESGGIEKPESFGGGDGALQRALSRRGTPMGGGDEAQSSAPVRDEPSVPAKPEDAPEVAWKQIEKNQKVLMNSGEKRARETAVSLAEIQAKNYSLERKLSETRTLLKEIRDSLT